MSFRTGSRRIDSSPAPGAAAMPEFAEIDTNKDGVISKEWSEYWIEISPQTSRGSFSAVSTPIFASKYALESSRRDLHNALLCTVLQSQFFRQKSPKLFREWINEYSLIQSQTIRILHFFCEFLMNFFPDFAPNSRKMWRVSLFQSNLRKQIRNLPKILNFVKKIH